MKILLVTAAFLRSEDDKILDFMYEFAREFRRNGHEVMVVAAHTEGTPKRDEIDGIKIRRFQYFWPASAQRLAYGIGIAESVKKSWMARIQLLPYLASGMLSVNSAINEFKPDVVHAVWAFPQGLMCSMLRRLRKFPLVVSIVGSEAYLAERFNVHWLIKHATGNAEALTANSNATRAAAMRCGARNKKFEMIFWGIDAERFKPDVKGDEIRKRFGLEKKRVVLTVAKMIERKGIKYVIEAMPHVLEKMPDAVLLVGGYGPQMDSLKARAAELNLGSKVVFSGRVASDELAKFYAASDCFVLAAATDEYGIPEGGQSLVTKQAMAMKKPVVSTNIGGIPDAVIDNKTGLLVEEKNPEMLADAIVRILKDKNLAERLGNGGYELVMREASWPVIIKKYTSLFGQIISKKNKKDK